MRPNPSFALSATALVVAVLGTTPLAAIAQNTAFPRNSVGSTQLKRGAVTAAKIAPEAVRAAHVQNGSLLAEDFKPGQLPQGPKGDRGDKGDKGDRGEQGAQGLSGYEIVTIASARQTTNSFDVEVACPAGKRVLGGGLSPSDWAWGNGPYVRRTYPNATGTGWIVSMATLPPTTMSNAVTAYAVCATVS